jgi:hypothetical protein
MLLCHHFTLTAVTRTVSDLPGTHQRLKSRPPATAALAGLLASASQTPVAIDQLALEHLADASGGVSSNSNRRGYL